jgi:hypothetical protein
VKTKDSPSCYFAASVKASSKYYEESPLNNTTPFLPEEKIAPIALSSNCTTGGLSNFYTQALIFSSMPA